MDIVKNFAHVFSGVGKLKIFQLKFLSDFFQVAEPLRTLARKDQQFMWEDAQQKSFQKLKDLLPEQKHLLTSRMNAGHALLLMLVPQA